MTDAEGNTNESSLITYIKAFVEKKTGCGVNVVLSRESISIKPLRKRPEVAKLWKSVLQHDNNFPPLTFPYDELDELVLKAEGMNFSVWMNTGTFRIQGRDAKSWFLSRFKDILDKYDPTFQGLSGMTFATAEENTESDSSASSLDLR